MAIRVRAAAGYYGGLMKGVHAALGGAAHVTTVASLGFCIDADNAAPRGATFSLDEQTRHKAAFVRQRCLDAHALPVVVAGHSIGHYMAMRAVRDLEDTGSAGASASSHRCGNPARSAMLSARCAHSGDKDALVCRVAAVMGLMPFLETSRSEGRQERVRAIAAHGDRVALAAAALSWLPAPAKRALVWLGDRGMDDASVAATAALVRGDVARAAFCMARHEFHDLSAPSQGWGDLRHFATSGRCAPPPLSHLLTTGRSPSHAPGPYVHHVQGVCAGGGRRPVVAAGAPRPCTQHAAGRVHRAGHISRPRLLHRRAADRRGGGVARNVDACRTTRYICRCAASRTRHQVCNALQRVSAVVVLCTELRRAAARQSQQRWECSAGARSKI